MSVGAVIDSQHAVSRALAGPFDEAHAYAKGQPVKHADETGWWQKNGRGCGPWSRRRSPFYERAKARREELTLWRFYGFSEQRGA